MTDVVYDFCSNIDIGVSAIDKTSLTNIFYYWDDIETPESDGQVRPIDTVNAAKPVAVSGENKHYTMVMALDSLDDAFPYVQQVEAGDAASRAIMDSADNEPIGLFEVTINKAGTGTEVRTFESTKVYCVNEEEIFNFEEGGNMITIYTFHCYGSVSIV